MAFRIPAILALIPLISSFVIFDSTSALSPKSSRGVPGTPIPRTSLGGVSEVRAARSLAAARTLPTPHWGPLGYCLSPRGRSVA
ncbi:hypothetical protein EDD15DRAFT_993733 [Pisolithus albus]|nr:hypothetical protein EDD15DRAFT_993733 [Pisolithus albus]